MSSHPEKISTREIALDTSEAAAKQSEKLRKLESSAEKGAEHSGEQLAADARMETESIFAKEAGKERHQGGEPTASPSTIRKITKREKQRAFKQTLTRVQSEMSTPARTFSKIIHAPIVEKTSDVIGNTAARPNALLTGSVMAFILLSIIYLVGLTYGYQLSGFEMIAAYGLGWVLGLLGDYVKIMATGRA
jgi:hypothetical protein